MAEQISLEKAAEQITKAAYDAGYRQAIQDAENWIKKNVAQGEIAAQRFNRSLAGE